jgi:hypothetical protein
MGIGKDFHHCKVSEGGRTRPFLLC